MRARTALALLAIAGFGCSSGGSSTSPATGPNIVGSWTFRDSTAIRYVYTGDGTEVRVWQVHFGPETIAATGSGRWTMNGSDTLLLCDSTTSNPHSVVSDSGPFPRVAILGLSGDSLYGFGASGGAIPLSGVSSTVIQGAFASPPLASNLVCPGYSGFAQAGSLQCTETVKLTKR
ncbi:MAG: hypothetical protein ABSB58_01735 [Gemmatimonadales bacterium]|jgi:hypothetical protein